MKTTELREMLDRTAHRIADHGTPIESHVLEVMSSAVRDLCPGAAAALIDWNGSEIARLRAFGIVHGVLLREIPASEHARLTSRLRRTHHLVLAA